MNRKRIHLIFFCSWLIATGSLLAAPSPVIWLDGISLEREKKMEGKATIYFVRWTKVAEMYAKSNDHKVAIQLFIDFDPFPTDEIDLPSLRTLSCIDDPMLVVQYLDFLENLVRTKGVDYLVTPDTLALSAFEKEVLKLAIKNSPAFFIEKSQLLHEPPTKKKEFKSAFDEKKGPVIPVVSVSFNQTKVTKWLERYGSDAALAKDDGSFESIGHFPSELKIQLFEKAVAAVDAYENLPLQTQEITYLGNDEALRNWLTKHAQVIGYRKEHVPVIVDLRKGKTEILEDDILIVNSTDLYPDLKNSRIIVPFNLNKSEVILGNMLFGAQEIVGRNASLPTKSIQNSHAIGYSVPSWQGLAEDRLRKLDSIAHRTIRRYATPGLQVAVVKEGSVVFQKSYGYYTYDSLKFVEDATLYDVASLTKVLATLPATALLIDQGKLSLDDPIGAYLPEFTGSNKAHFTIRQLLGHQAGLQAYIPFWSMALSGDRLDAFYYKTTEDAAKDIRTYGLEPNPLLLDTLKSFIIKSDLIERPEEYRYSDLGFMILHMIVERVSNQPFDQFLKENFYIPMGMTSTTFNPQRQGYTFKDIAPTEFDQRFRNYQVWGEVHDRNSAVFGGVAGHAGLFSNSNDVAKMMCMLLNDGYYGGRQYISKSILDQFNLRYFQSNRRGLGWDKTGGTNNIVSRYASEESFGHTGFTGTMVWADPKEDLIFIFLSNRVYPDANNWKLNELGTRTLMHDVIYESIKLN